MLGRNSPAAVGLCAGSDAAAVSGLADTGVENGPEGVPGREICAAVPVEARDLEIDRAGALLQCDDRVIVNLALSLIEKGGGEITDAINGEPEPGREVRNIRDLELAA